MTADEKLLFNVNNSPHIRDDATTPRIMFTVCLALAPALLWAVAMFGWRALTPIVSCVVACVATEWLCQRWRGGKPTINDGSAVVTGLLLAAVSPADLPWWSAAIGGVFAIAIAKQAFGGLGHNIWNPALLARAFMQTSMPERMMGEWPGLTAIGRRWRDLLGAVSGVDAATAVANAESVSGVDAMTAATFLERIASAEAADFAGTAVQAPPEALTPTWADVLMTWLGVERGSLGEVSAVLLVLGGLYLVRKKIVPWDIPFFYLIFAAVLAWVLPQPYKVGDSIAYTAWFQGPWLMHLGAGGLMLGAFFMATDMVTTPLTQKGRIVFAIGCGIMTMLIRVFGGYPEGACYAILLMNTCVPLIDSMTKPRGAGRRKA